MAGGRGTHRFDDPLLLGVALVPGGLQVRQVRRQDKRLRKEAELLLAELSQQSRQVAPQTVLAAELERAGEMVELKHAHRQESCRVPECSEVRISEFKLVNRSRELVNSQFELRPDRSSPTWVT